MGSALSGGRSRHVMSAFICGLDVHKDSTYATILDPEEKIVNQVRMRNERVLSYLSRFNVGRIAIESSSQVASLYRQLASRGYSVMVSHPKKTRYIAEARVKSDRVDSKVIAELARLGALPLAYISDKETAILQEQVRRRAFLVRERVKLRVKIKSILTYEGIRWPSDSGLFARKGVGRAREGSFHAWKNHV